MLTNLVVDFYLNYALPMVNVYPEGFVVLSCRVSMNQPYMIMLQLASLFGTIQTILVPIHPIPLVVDLLLYENNHGTIINYIVAKQLG